MNITLLENGLFVMIIGMGTVFTFLTLMVLTMYVNSIVLKNIINKYFPEEVPAEKAAAKKAESNDSEVAAAVACAIKKAGKAAA